MKHERGTSRTGEKIHALVGPGRTRRAVCGAVGLKRLGRTLFDPEETNACGTCARLVKKMADE